MFSLFVCDLGFLMLIGRNRPCITIGNVRFVMVDLLVFVTLRMNLLMLHWAAVSCSLTIDQHIIKYCAVTTLTIQVQKINDADISYSTFAVGTFRCSFMLHSFMAEDVIQVCDQMTTQLDLAVLHNAGTKSASRSQALAALAWPTSCSWESLATALNGYTMWLQTAWKCLNAHRLDGSEQPTHQPAQPPHTHRTLT